jgi:hypothetical protein
VPQADCEARLSCLSHLLCSDTIDGFVEFLPSLTDPSPLQQASLGAALPPQQLQAPPPLQYYQQGSSPPMWEHQSQYAPPPHPDLLMEAIVSAREEDLAVSTGPVSWRRP